MDNNNEQQSQPQPSPVEAFRMSLMTKVLQSMHILRYDMSIVAEGPMPDDYVQMCKKRLLECYSVLPLAAGEGQTAEVKNASPN